MKSTFEKILNYQTLSEEEAYQSLLKIAKNEVSMTQTIAFLTIFSLRTVVAEELSGFRKAMLELSLRINLDEFEGMDVCGTGGDGKNTFNISTTTAFVVAGAGQSIIKHGNHGVSSAVGSSTVIEYLGHKFSNDKAVLQKSLEKSNICFLHAPLFHPAMKTFAPIRKDLGFKTFFNILGPLLNPAQIQKQFIGVYHWSVARLYQPILEKSVEKYGIVHTLGGYDEISLTNNSLMISKQGEKVISPFTFTSQKITASDLVGGNVEESSKIVVALLKNEVQKAKIDVVIANAALILQVAKPEISLEEAKGLADESIKSGRAYTCLKKFLNT